MKDGDEFDRLHDEYLAFLDEGAGDYLQEHAEIMQDSLGLDSADTVPVVGINPLTAEPYIMTLAMVGYKEINGEMYQCSLSWYPFPKLPIEVLRLLHKKENTRMADDGDEEDLVAELLRRRLAIVALIEDTDDADAVGWRQVLKEVQTGQRNTNFEDAMGADFMKERKAREKSVAEAQSVVVDSVENSNDIGHLQTAPGAQSSKQQSTHVVKQYTVIVSLAEAESIRRALQAGNGILQGSKASVNIMTVGFDGLMLSQFSTKFDDEELLSDLRSLSSHDLMNAIAKGEFWDEQRDLARIIGDDIVVPKEGILGSLSDSNKHANVPIIFGINKDENKLFNFFDEKYVSNFFNIYFRVRDAFYYDLISDYQSLAWRSNGLDTPADLVKNSGQENVYAYRFDWDEEPKVLGMDFSLLLGAAHAFEIPFIMGDFDFGDQTSFLYDKKKTQERDRLSLSMMSYWAEFARSGNPSTSNNSNLPKWTSWKSGGLDSFRIMILDTLSSGGPKMDKSYVPISNLVSIFDEDIRSNEVDDKCEFLNIAYSWVDNWKLKNNSCLGD